MKQLNPESILGKFVQGSETSDWTVPTSDRPVIESMFKLSFNGLESFAKEILQNGPAGFNLFFRKWARSDFFFSS